MARKKTTVNQQVDYSDMERADQDLTLKLGEAFDKILLRDFGHLRAPEPITTPIGIQHVDALLGGGILSSDPILLSSTPETGKSTLAFQFSKSFQTKYENSVVVYLDVEGSSNSETSQFRQTRIEIFGLDKRRFKYEPIVTNVNGVFELILKLIEIKKAFEEKLNKEFYIAFIWDSIASTPAPKTEEAENPNSIIGNKARLVSFLLDKYMPSIKFNRVTFVCIDQIRANLKIEGPYAQQEKSVGTFKDFKSATNIYALQHKTQQWLFLSRGKLISPAEGLGIDGWFMHIHTEKNKLAPSQHSVTVVFDKKYGIDKFWSEFYFLLEPTLSEKKIYKNSPPSRLFMMKKTGSRVKLVVKDENGQKQWESDSFYRKDAKDKYLNNEEFRQWFDYAVQISVHQRITQGIFKCDLGEINENNKNNECVDPEIENIVTDTLDNPVELKPEISPQDTEIVNNEEFNPPDIEQSDEIVVKHDEEQIGEEHFVKQNDNTGYQSVFSE